jgi:homoserine acetyltransferase
MPNAEFAVLDSPNGHDAFLIETEKLERIVTTFLADAQPASALSGLGSSWA